MYVYVSNIYNKNKPLRYINLSTLFIKLFFFIFIVFRYHYIQHNK